MRNEVIFDNRGIPDIMVVFTPDELGLPAEIRGKAVKEYAISKYPNTLIGGVPYSMPYQQPAVNINHDEAIRLCEAKGPGWHLLTNDEWAALAHQSRKNGTRFLTGKLAEYFETVPHKATKTKESYRLLSGTLTRKLGGSQMKQDDAQLVQYLKDSGQLEFIKTEEKPKRGDFKKRLEIIGGSAVDKETGEIVEGVQIIEKPDTFSVDV